MIAEHTLLEQLFLEPDRNGGPERPKAARRKGKIGLEQTLEFEKRLFVEHDMVERARVNAGFRQTVTNRRGGKAGIVLPAREAFFLCRRNHLAINHKRRGTVMVEGRDSQDTHLDCSEQRIDE